MESWRQGFAQHIRENTPSEPFHQWLDRQDDPDIARGSKEFRQSIDAIVSGVVERLKRYDQAFSVMNFDEMAQIEDYAKEKANRHIQKIMLLSGISRKDAEAEYLRHLTRPEK